MASSSPAPARRLAGAVPRRCRSSAGSGSARPRRPASASSGFRSPAGRSVLSRLRLPRGRSLTRPRPPLRTTASLLLRARMRCSVSVPIPRRPALPKHSRRPPRPRAVWPCGSRSASRAPVVGCSASRAPAVGRIG
ncbi:hypothetical protein VPH35_136747 [Triticum aestivum]